MLSSFEIFIASLLKFSQLPIFKLDGGVTRHLDIYLCVLVFCKESNVNDNRFSVLRERQGMVSTYLFLLPLKTFYLFYDVLLLCFKKH